MGFLEGLTCQVPVGGAYVAEFFAPEEGVVRIPLKLQVVLPHNLFLVVLLKTLKLLKSAIKKPFSAEGRKEIIQGWSWHRKKAVRCCTKSKRNIR